jgi:hypothetical protein
MTFGDLKSKVEGSHWVHSAPVIGRHVALARFGLIVNETSVEHVIEEFVCLFYFIVNIKNGNLL